VGDELDRLTAMFSTLLVQQRQQLDEGIHSVAEAFRRAADRIAAQASTAAPTTPAGAVAAAGAAPPMPSGSGGVLAVRVVNDSSMPVPVTMASAPQRQERGGFWGVLSGIAGGFGSLLGGIVGGFLGGGLGGMVFGAELIIALGMLGPLIDKFDGILNRFYAFTNTLIVQVRGLIRLLFSELTAAGIFPVSRLFASLLLFIDLGISVVLAHLRVVINWVEQLAQTLVTWVGQLLNGLVWWLQTVLNRLPPFLSGLLTYLMEQVVRPYVAAIVRDAVRSLAETLAALLLGSAFAIGAIIMESMSWAWDWGLNKLVEILNHIPGISMTVPPPPGSYDARVEAAMRGAMTAGRTLAEGWTRGILGPAPGPGGTPVPLPTAPPPTIRLPGFRMPELELPEFPEVRPQLEGILRAATTPAEPTPPATRAPVPEPGPTVTLNGGVNVSIAAQAIDREHADQTGREIAGSLMDELRRLTERERFRLGLPTTATS
jgi:hypothetical protein